MLSRRRYVHHIYTIHTPLNTLYTRPIYTPSNALKQPIKQAARKAEQDAAIRKREMQPLEPIMIEYEHADVGELYVCHHIDYNTLYIPFIYPLYTRYTCIYTIYSLYIPNTPPNTPYTPLFTP